MKIITWNCNLAFRKKAEFILVHHPDILIVQECEHPDYLMFPSGTPIPPDTLWFGRNPHKGFGIFSYTGYRFEALHPHNIDLQTIIPLSVTGGHLDFNLFAKWAYHPTDPEGRYVEQVYKAIHYYDSLLRNTKTMLVGDYNSNKIWDKKHSKLTHSNIVKLLEDKGILSTYHLFFNQEQGTELHPTLYLYRHKNRPYHIDYCFVSEDMANRINEVEVGDYDYWIKYGDHVPVIVTFNEV